MPSDFFAMLQLVPTADGSMTLYSPRFNQWYHSLVGALEESRRVYLELGLTYVAQRPSANPAVPIRLLEMGFGTGLNAILTERAAAQLGVQVQYTGLEAYPIGSDVVGALQFEEWVDSPIWPRLHDVAWEKEHALTPSFTLLKRETTLQEFLNEPPGEPFDLVYYDAFAPSSQPELWTTEVFAKLLDHLAPGGVLTTYCSKSVVRRALEAAGFRVEKHPGPWRKREVVRAVRES